MLIARPQLKASVIRSSLMNLVEQIDREEWIYFRVISEPDINVFLGRESVPIMVGDLACICGDSGHRLFDRSSSQSS